MRKLNIAVFFGGNSSEYQVSLASAYSVICNLNKDRYVPVMVGISRKGDWFYFTGDVDRIKEDTWLESGACIPAVLSPNREEHALLLLKDGSVDYVRVDVAFPVLHGKNGEDGTLQGMIELAGIPLAGCGTLACALCMDKNRAHKLAGAEGVRVPGAFVVTKKMDKELVYKRAGEIGYPLFVKPVKGGSSYGVTKVQTKDALQGAVELAFSYDDQVIVEENIEGFEVGCAVLGNDSLLVGAVDEIELSGGFFDYTEKYTLKTSAIHVPARISSGKTEEIKETAKRIYKALGCRGFARVDLFLTPGGEIVFNEVNTIPGFTEHSRYPGMMKEAGHSFAGILDKIIELAVETRE